MTDEYSEEQLDDIRATVGKWYEGFATSTEFAQLSEEHQRKAGAITEFFAQYSYSHLGVSLQKWTPGDVWECYGILRGRSQPAGANPMRKNARLQTTAASRSSK